jgi:type III pantothenate kinase
MNSKNIAVDIGNTRIKSGEFVDGKLTRVDYWESIISMRASYSGQEVIWGFSNVRVMDDLPIIFQGTSYHLITSDTQLPISIDYKTPETLGIDRLMGVIGARELFQDVPLLVIDLGTCITYDVLTLEDVYIGGAISPGLVMRMKAMSQLTHKLPDVSPDWKLNLPVGLGKSTAECLVKGSFDAILFEMEGFIKSLKKDFPHLTVILTGGDAPSFESSVKEPIFADQNLVLRGINKTLRAL